MSTRWKDALNWLVPVALAAGSLLLAGHERSEDHGGRLIKLETQRTGDVEQLQRIEKRIERLDEKVDELIRRGLGR